LTIDHGWKDFSYIDKGTAGFLMDMPTKLMSFTKAVTTDRLNGAKKMLKLESVSLS